MSLKRVSVIVPACNEEKHIQACIDSLSNQNCPSALLEILLVDNGSTDRTREMAEALGARVLRNDSMNVSGLRNLGARESSGEIVAFVDADCVVSNGWLESSMIYFDDASVAAWGCAPTPPPDALTWVQETWLMVIEKDKTVAPVDWLGTANLFVKREHFQSVGGFNESLVTCEDVDLCYRLGKLGKIISDKRLKATHLREPSTIREFVRKEMWRGRNNFSVTMSHGLTLKELPSLSIPLYFGLLLPALFLLAVLTLSYKWGLVFCLFYMLPTLASLFKVRGRMTGIRGLLRLSILLQFYFFSRTFAILKIK